MFHPKTLFLVMQYRKQHCDATEHGNLTIGIEIAAIEHHISY